LRQLIGRIVLVRDRRRAVVHFGGKAAGLKPTA
jgi:hypothetical protein